ncbi:MAG: hypothetical protein Fur0014_01350 [Rubrivivax sp.]
MNTIRFALAALALSASAVQAATPTLYGNRAAFMAATTAHQVQDFEGYADGTDLAGVAVLPGVTISTNLDSIAVFQGSGDKEAFATSRNGPEAWYDITIRGGAQAFGFDVDAFDPATPGPAFLSFFFADGDTTYTEIPILPVNATEDDPLFFGIVSSVPVVGIRWYEGPEIGGLLCCEETALDNLVLAAPVPEPATTALWLAGAGLMAAARRRAARQSQA